MTCNCPKRKKKYVAVSTVRRSITVRDIEAALRGESRSSNGYVWGYVADTFKKAIYALYHYTDNDDCDYDVFVYENHKWRCVRKGKGGMEYCSRYITGQEENCG